MSFYTIVLPQNGAITSAITAGDCGILSVLSEIAFFSCQLQCVMMGIENILIRIIFYRQLRERKNSAGFLFIGMSVLLNS